MEARHSRRKHDKKSIYFGKEIFVLKLFGLSLTGNESVSYKIYSSVILFCTIFMYSILSFVEYFKQDFDGIANLIVYQISTTLSVCKVATVILNRKSLRKLLCKLEEPPFLANSKRGGDKEQQLIRECLQITNIQTCTYWILATISVTTSILYTFVKHVKYNDNTIFPYGPFTVLNTTCSPNYEITYFYQSTSIVFAASLFTSIDLLLAAVLANLCYQFKILQNNIRRLIKMCYLEMLKDFNKFQDKSQLKPHLNSEIEDAEIPWKYLKKSLSEVIKYHLAIINIATEMEQAFRYLFLIVFLGTLGLLCFSVYGASVFADNPQMVVRHLCEGICACLQIAIICYWGEEVMHESQSVGRAVYESNFVGTDLRYQMMLVLVIRRSQNPTTFSAGKFAIIGLAAFTWVLRTSYSSFMILRSANEISTP